ncbi:GDYXXLXY domain-containing protein [Bosea sp. PAMC 26642]|uniref:GDYXXLXY domain-containing protein n=1 Tax=Bosea sp. (strain PAMC 26642) TaxID=1792307 RepID=UPI0007705916|nr:GDYXXLXY domain-containing protein [Bosea sp. PAMC 26642]AMJ60417.1 hypothetical protein AXW83_09045 [Bosea sp. PAMC 26642]
MRVLSLDTVTLRLPVLWRALLAMLVLCGAIGALVESRASILRSGTEVRLKTAPIDPRDLFRGDYVVLSYDISVVDAAASASDRPFQRGEPVHVRLAPNAEGFAQVVGVSRERPAASSSEVVMAGHVRVPGTCLRDNRDKADCTRGSTGLRIAYGIESYFVPEGTGLAIEMTDRSRIEVVAAVAASGEAAIKRLLIDGKLVHAEPPY